jgi:hypothetical protein
MRWQRRERILQVREHQAVQLLALPVGLEQRLAVRLLQKLAASVDSAADRLHNQRTARSAATRP